MQKLWISLLFILMFLALPASAISYFNTTDDILINLDNGAYITLLVGQIFSNTTDPVVRTYNSADTPSSTLEINFNDTKARWNTTNNMTLDNISYINDMLNFTGNAITGTLNITAKMLNNNKLYYLFVDSIKNTSVTSNVSGWVDFNYSSWSQHEFSIQPDISFPTLTSESVSPLSTSTSSSVTITALFVDNTGVSSAIVKVQVPNGTSTNWSMVCTSGTNVTCTKSYTTTSEIGTYYVKYYYPQDDSGNIANISSSLSFNIVTDSGGSGGGGGGGSAYVAPTLISTPIPNVTSIFIPTFKSPDVSTISEIKIPDISNIKFQSILIKILLFLIVGYIAITFFNIYLVKDKKYNVKTTQIKKSNKNYTTKRVIKR